MQAATDKQQLDMPHVYPADDQDVVLDSGDQQFPSFREHQTMQNDNSIMTSSSAGEGARPNQLAPIGLKKRLPPGTTPVGVSRNVGGDNLRIQRSSPVQEESVEEEPEYESAQETVMMNDVDRAKQRLAEMEKRYNTITFKQKKQQKKKAMLEKYTSFNYNNSTTDWNKQVQIPRSIVAKEEEETQYNFKMPQKFSSPNNVGTQKSRISVFTSQKARTASEGPLNNFPQNEFNKTTADGFRSLSKLSENIKDGANFRAATSYLNSLKQDKLQTPPIPTASSSKLSPQVLNPKNHQFSTLEQAKRFRQRSLLEAAAGTVSKNSLERGDRGTDTADLLLPQDTLSPGHQTMSVFKNSQAPPKSLLPIPRSTSTAVNQSTQPNQQTVVSLSWMDEQKLKRLLKEFESVDFTFQFNTNEDPLQKIKKQLSFLIDKGIKMMNVTCSNDICGIFERSLKNILYFNDQRLTYFRNEIKFYQMEKEKHLVMLEERDALLAIYRERDLSEEEKMKMAWKYKQVRNDKYKMFDEAIDELFTTDALKNIRQAHETPQVLLQTEEEREREDGERVMNFRRMNWLEKDMDLMMRLIQMDIGETSKTQAQSNIDNVLSVLGEQLKEGVGLGIANQIANFHIRIEEILKENQRLLKAKAPEKIDRCYQTENWNMERYLDELESLKRQKWILDKEVKESREKLDNNKERIKRLKDDLNRFMKKVQTMENKERMIDQILQGKDKEIAEAKQDLHLKEGHYIKKDIENKREMRAMMDRYEMLNNSKINREIELMKKEEEMNKKIENMENKVKEAKLAVSYFQKLLSQKTSQLDTMNLEMQLQLQALMGRDDDSNDPDTAKSIKKTKKPDLEFQQSVRSPHQNQPSNRGNELLTAKNSQKPTVAATFNEAASRPQPGAIKFSPRQPESPKAKPAEAEQPATEPQPKIKVEKLDPKFMHLERPETPRENGPLKVAAPPRPPYQPIPQVKPQSELMIVVEQSEATPLQQDHEPAEQHPATQEPHFEEEKKPQDSSREKNEDTIITFGEDDLNEVSRKEQDRQKQLSKHWRKTLEKLKLKTGPSAFLITTEEKSIQCENLGSSNDLSKFYKKPNFPMNPVMKPPGIAVSTQTQDMQTTAKSGNLLLEGDVGRKKTPNNGQRIKGSVAAQLKASKENPLAQSNILKFAVYLSNTKKSPFPFAGNKSPPPPPAKNINFLSDQFEMELELQLQSLKKQTQAYEDKMKEEQKPEVEAKKPPSRTKSPPVASKPPSRTEGLQRRTIQEDDDNMIKGRKTAIYSSDNGSRLQSADDDQTRGHTPIVLKPTIVDKPTLNMNASQFKSSTRKKVQGKKETSPPQAQPAPATQQPQQNQERKAVQLTNLAAKRNVTSTTQIVITEDHEEVKQSSTNVAQQNEEPPVQIVEENQEMEFIRKNQNGNKLKKGIESALNNLAQISKHAKYARNAAGILENMLTLKQQSANLELNNAPDQNEYANRRGEARSGTRNKNASASRESSLETSDKKYQSDGFDERTSVELAILEYYANMKPMKPFNAVIVGTQASMKQIMFSPDQHVRSNSHSPDRSSPTRKENGQDLPPQPLNDVKPPNEAIQPPQQVTAPGTAGSKGSKDDADTVELKVPEDASKKKEVVKKLDKK